MAVLGGRLRARSLAIARRCTGRYSSAQDCTGGPMTLRELAEKPGRHRMSVEPRWAREVNREGIVTRVAWSIEGPAADMSDRAMAEAERLVAALERSCRAAALREVAEKVRGI